VVRCGAGPARCRIECGAGEGCSCFYFPRLDVCWCECTYGVGGLDGLQVSPGTKVSVSVVGLPLGVVATKLDRVLERDVLVPAARAQKKVRLKMENVRLAEVLRALGLSTQRPASPRRRGAARRAV
jgi:hypothetical protein